MTSTSTPEESDRFPQRQICWCKPHDEACVRTSGGRKVECAYAGGGDARRGRMAVQVQPAWHRHRVQYHLLGYVAVTRQGDHASGPRCVGAAREGGPTASI